MTENIFVELVKQGGFAILAAVMFAVYRNDSKAWATKQAETASAFMAFGRDTATALTQVSETLRLQASILERIEAQLNANRICPVTQVTTEVLRDASSDSGGQGRRKVEHILATALHQRQAAASESR